MSSLGNLSNYLKEEGKITDYSWLDIPEDAPNTPFDEIPSHIAIPKLEEQWKHKKDDNLSFVPNMEIRASALPKMTNDTVLNYVNNLKKQMMLGKNGDDLKNYILETANSEMLDLIAKYIDDLENEEGLLGNVYIDISPFKSCAEAYETLNKKTKLAKFVVNSKCSNCVHCTNNRCSLFKKKIVSSVNYDSKLLDEYKNYFKANKNLDLDIKDKKDLQIAFLTPEHTTVKEAENKPNVNEVDEVSLEQKQKDFEKQLEDLKEELNDVEVKKATKNIAKVISKTSSIKTINNYVASNYSKEFITQNKKHFDNLFAKIGSLGKIYIESIYLPFNSCMEAKELKNTEPKYLVVHDKFCKCMSNKCLNLNMEKVPSLSEIPTISFMTEFNKYPENIKNKIKEIFELDPIKALRLCNLASQFITESSNIKEETPITAEIQEDITNLSPETKKVEKEYTKEDIKADIKSGFLFSDILKKTTKEDLLGVLDNIKSIYKYQNNVELKLPKTIKIKKSSKDVEHKINLDSANANIDYDSFDLQANDLEIEMGENKVSSEIIVEDLNEFII